MQASIKRGGISQYEERLASMGIKQILAGVSHPQTNGKIERFHGELQRKLHFFVESSDAALGFPGLRDKTDRKADSCVPAHIGGPFHTKGPQDPISRFVEWFNYNRPHMSLDRSRDETPAMAFERKKAPEGTDIRTVCEEDSND